MTHIAGEKCLTSGSASTRELGVDASILTRYDAVRDFSQKAFRSACYAPYTQLYFDTRGNVRVCCHNWKHSIGNITENSIDEIWNGEALKRVRGAVRAYDFSLGCGYCEWQLASGSLVNLSIRKWDDLPVLSSDPLWPQQMEFSISNTCNLECIMCDGDTSSAIRANRERRPPLSKVYSDAFFAELRKYLPHLRKARFLGGEPFLEQECYRIWDMLSEDRIPLPCHVTTNGTQFNSRIEKILDRMPFGIAVSVDGFTKETIESVRVHARYERLLENIGKFRAYALARKTSFGLTYCLMRPNWREFGDFCLWADDLDCSVFVNQVRRPAELSLFTLPLRDLQQIVDAMENQATTLLPRLRRHRETWLGQIQRLRQRSSGAVEVPELVSIATQAGARTDSARP
ncbi:MAG: radical SAM/SPASM domain-containing protein [Candidatus Acidiferrales bacterium]